MFQDMRLNTDQNLFQKIWSMSWGLLFLITLMACVGFAALYSAAGGDFDPWASRQISRFAVGMIALLIVAFMNIKWWFRLSYPIYILGFVLLIVVELMGYTGMGAQRWINLGFIQLQPSEFMKIAVVMALARYFHAASDDDLRSLKFLIAPFLMIALPVGLVLLQPDLGTSLMIVMAGITVIFLAGAPLWLFFLGGGSALAALPVAWYFMHDYQKRRVMTFLNPESDPLGAGYHITQSKIALGSQRLTRPPG